LASARSTRPAHDAQVIPVTGRVTAAAVAMAVAGSAAVAADPGAKAFIGAL
jgi:hypothetical protein